MTGYNLKPFEKRIEEIGEWLASELKTIRSGRATPALLDRVLVEVYGQHLELRQLAAITVEDPRRLRVALWDKNQIKNAEAALQAANLGVSVAAAGNTLIVGFPELTSEKKGALIKLAKNKVEEAKISLRQERDKTWKDIQERERRGDLSEDDKFRLKEILQKLVDDESQKLDAAGQRKEAEITA